jgi:circadian clock protein KaiC
MGPAGSGKSSLALRYALSAIARGEHVALFAFDERVQTLLLRARGLGLALDQALACGRLRIQQIDPAEMGPGEFVASVNRAATEEKTRVIIIDSLNGYLNAMPEERALALQLHELLSVLTRRGVSSFLVMAQHGIVGPTMTSPIDVSYLADTVIMLRFFEADGRVRKAMSVLKKRSGFHEETIREFRMGPPDGISVGEPLTGFRGVLTGVPSYVGAAATLMTPVPTKKPRTGVER